MPSVCRSNLLFLSSLSPPGSDVRSEYLKLLPTIFEGATFKAPNTGRSHMQPMITYLLQAWPVRCTPPLSIAAQTREIKVLPSIPASPPLQLGFYPGDYNTSFSKPLRRHRWSRPIGQLTVSAVEPQALNILTSTPKASTIATVKLLFDICKTHKPDIQPYAFQLTVKSYLRIQTFYTT